MAPGPRGCWRMAQASDWAERADWRRTNRFGRTPFPRRAVQPPKGRRIARPTWFCGRSGASLLLPRRYEHGDGFDLDEQFGTAQNRLDPGGSRKRVQSLLMEERGAPFVERRVIALHVAEVARGAHHVLPGGALGREEAGDIVVSPAQLCGKVAHMDGLAVFVDAGRAGDQQDGQRVQVDAQSARKRAWLLVRVGFVEHRRVADGAALYLCRAADLCECFRDGHYFESPVLIRIP